MYIRPIIWIIFIFLDELQCYILRHFRLTFQMFLFKKKERKYFLINFGDALTGCPRAGQGDLWSNLCWHTERQRQQINRLTTYKLRIIDLIIYWHKNIYLVIFFVHQKCKQDTYIFFFQEVLYNFFVVKFRSTNNIGWNLHAIDRGEGTFSLHTEQNPSRNL